MSNKSQRAFLGMSHSPLLGLNPISRDIETSLKDVVDKARDEVRQFDPELIVLIGPDHYNGFFNELMPPFCLGTQATSVGDYLTPAGELNVPEGDAVDLGRHFMDDGFDVAMSRRMQVDHGFAQALQFMWGGLNTPPVLPIFMNAVAAPGIPRMVRCRQLGESIGRWLDLQSRRTLVIGSGGLSHEPPVPTLEHPDVSVRERITIKCVPTPEEVTAKTQRVMAAGMALAGGESDMKPLSPAWDRRWMDAIQTADFNELDAMTEESITDEAGLSAHESKTWLIGRAAAHGANNVKLRYYQDIPELIAGYGLLFMAS